MPVKSIIQSLFENITHLFIECVYVRNRWCSRSFPFSVIFFHNQKVKIVSSVFDCFCFFHRFFTDCGYSQSRRKGKSFLNTGKDNIYTEFINFDFCSCHTAYSINHEYNIGIFFHNLSNFGYGRINTS